MAARDPSTEAQAVLDAAVAAYRAAFGTRLRAAYALGSLAHGGFSAAVSDVDLGVILDDPLEPGDAATVQRVAWAARETGSELARRLSVFWGTESTLRGEAEGGRFPPLDRLDLIENGRLLAGVDVRCQLPRPDRLELLESGAQFALGLLAPPDGGLRRSAAARGSMGTTGENPIEEICDAEQLASRGVRQVTKLVLFPVRFMFSAETGRVGTNDDAVLWYLARDDVPARELVAGALAWREAPPAGDRALLALLEDLPGLYLHYIADHLTRLTSAGRAELADAFLHWQARLASEIVASQAARELSDALSHGRLIPLLTERYEPFDEHTAYVAAARLHARRTRRGERPVGRKIGFTNRTIWARYGVWAPIWGYVYDSTVSYATSGIAELTIEHLLQPRIEPEIVLHFARTPPSSGDETEILDSIDWIAHGFEIVHCPFRDWRFTAPDAVATGSLHGALVVGRPVAVQDVDDWLEKLRAFRISLHRDGASVAEGAGANVLDTPLLAFAHLARVLAQDPNAQRVEAGELVTTGTLTDALPVAAGETWSTRLEGIELPELSLTLR